MCCHSTAQLQRIFHGQAGALHTSTSRFGFSIQITQPLLPSYPAAGAMLPGRKGTDVGQNFYVADLKGR